MGFYAQITLLLTLTVVQDIHYGCLVFEPSSNIALFGLQNGGNDLGMSQGGSVASKIVDSIQDLGINQINLSAIFIHRSRFQCTLLHLLFQKLPNEEFKIIIV